MVKPFHHTKLELIGYLGLKEITGPLYSLMGPWGPQLVTKLISICLRLFRWSSPIITPNLIPVAALVPEKWHRPLFYIGPLGPLTFDIYG